MYHVAVGNSPDPLHGGSYEVRRLPTELLVQHQWPHRSPVSSSSSCSSSPTVAVIDQQNAVLQRLAPAINVALINDNNRNDDASIGTAAVRLFRDRAFRNATLVPVVPTPFAALIIPVQRRQGATAASVQTARALKKLLMQEQNEGNGEENDDLLHDDVDTSSTDNKNKEKPKKLSRTEFVLLEAVSRLQTLLEGFMDDGSEREELRRHLMRTSSTSTSTGSSSNNNNDFLRPLIDITLLLPCGPGSDSKSFSSVVALLDFRPFDIVAEQLNRQQQQHQNQNQQRQKQQQRRGGEGEQGPRSTSSGVSTAMAASAAAASSSIFSYRAHHAAMDCIWHINEKAKTLTRGAVRQPQQQDLSTAADGRCPVAVPCDLRPASATGRWKVCPDLLEDSYELPTCITCLDRIESQVTGFLQRELCGCPAAQCNCVAGAALAGCAACRHMLFATRGMLQSSVERDRFLITSTNNNGSKSAGGETAAPPENFLFCSGCASSAPAGANPDDENNTEKGQQKEHSTAVSSSSSSSLDDLWTCCVCGYVGCSRYTGQHAKRHYEFSGHEFALNLVTQQIWDYSADEFVHRWIAKGQAEAARSARAVERMRQRHLNPLQEHEGEEDAILVKGEDGDPSQPELIHEQQQQQHQLEKLKVPERRFDLLLEGATATVGGPPSSPPIAVFDGTTVASSSAAAAATAPSTAVAGAAAAAASTTSAHDEAASAPEKQFHKLHKQQQQQQQEEDGHSAVKFLVDAKLESKAEKLCHEYSRQLMLQLDANRTRLMATLLHEASVAADSTPFGIVFRRNNKNSGNINTKNSKRGGTLRADNFGRENVGLSPEEEVVSASKELREQLLRLQRDKMECAEAKAASDQSQAQADALKAAVRQNMEVKHAYDTQLAARLKQLREDVAEAGANLAAAKKLQKQGYVSGERIAVVGLPTGAIGAAPRSGGGGRRGGRR